MAFNEDRYATRTVPMVLPSPLVLVEPASNGFKGVINPLTYIFNSFFNCSSKLFANIFNLIFKD